MLAPEGAVMLAALANAWEMTHMVVEIEDTNEEVLVIGPGAQPLQSQEQQDYQDTNKGQEAQEEDDEVEEIEIVQEEGGGAPKKEKGKKKRKKGSYIDVPFKPQS